VYSQGVPDLVITALPARFWNRVEPDSDHWIWTGQINNKGYGLAWWNGKKRPAHVAVWEALIGPIPEGLELDHTCDRTECVNPAHLEVVTHAENMRRSSERQTHCRKAGHPRTAENVYRDPHGNTRCRLCAREADARRVPRRRRRT
jgi:hypothetical protein